MTSRERQLSTRLIAMRQVFAIRLVRLECSLNIATSLRGNNERNAWFSSGGNHSLGPSFKWLQKRKVTNLSSRYTARNENLVLVVLASPSDSIALRAF